MFICQYTFLLYRKVQPAWPLQEYCVVCVYKCKVQTQCELKLNVTHSDQLQSRFLLWAADPVDALLGLSGNLTLLLSTTVQLSVSVFAYT